MLFWPTSAVHGGGQQHKTPLWGSFPWHRLGSLAISSKTQHLSWGSFSTTPESGFPVSSPSAVSFLITSSETPEGGFSANPSTCTPVTAIQCTWPHLLQWDLDLIPDWESSFPDLFLFWVFCFSPRGSVCSLSLLLVELFLSHSI